jgi:outer membrane protein
MRYPILLVSACLLAQTPPTLTLEQAREMALANHPLLASLDYSSRAAAETPKQILSALAPQLNLGITASVADDNTRFAIQGLSSSLLISRAGAGVQLSQLITDFGRTRLLADSASSRADAQKEVVNSTRLQVLSAVDRAYYSILRARSLNRVAEQTVQARKLIVDQVEALTNSQLRSTLDLSFARVNLADAEILLNRARNEQGAAEAELTAALGLRERPVFQIDDRPVNEALPPEAEPLVQRALQDRPELRQLALELQSATQLLEAEKRLSKPTVSFVGSVGALPLAKGNYPNRYGAAGVSLSLPVFNGRLFESRQAEVALRMRAVEKLRESNANQIARDIRAAFLNARNSFDRLRLTQQLLDQARLSLDLAQTRYELGLGSIVELSQAQLSQTAADVASANARYEYQILRSVLRFQLGEGAL